MVTAPFNFRLLDEIMTVKRHFSHRQTKSLLLLLVFRVIVFTLSCQIPYNLLFPQVGSFLRWIHESSSQLKERSFEQSSKVWSGREIVGAMEKQGITPATFKIYSVSGFLFPFYILSSSFLKGRTAGHTFKVPLMTSYSSTLKLVCV